METKKVLLGPGEGYVEEKKSKFLAVAEPVSTEAQARAVVEQQRKKYHDARHHVFAFQVGEHNEIQRYSDDGEPQGTAGMPVLQVILGEGVSNCVIVVTRYFGGTLLGTGGLVRCYGRAAKEALLDAGVGEVGRFDPISVTVDYAMQGKLSYEIGQRGLILEDTVFTDQVEFCLLCRQEETASLLQALQEMTSGRAKIVQGQTREGILAERKIRLLP